MKIQEILNILEAWAPKAYAEDFDNTGLLVGNAHQKCTGALITLDTLPETILEAKSKNCNLIISFHPIIFKGLKRLTGSDYVEQTVLEAIKNDICIYALHTALDNHIEGVSFGIARQLGLKNRQLLLPKKNTIKKLTTYVPQQHAETLLESLHAVGAGQIGSYDRCSFSNTGTGAFRGDQSSNPTLGKAGQDEKVSEVQLHLVYKKHLEADVLKALFASHPYEEIAYEITPLDNVNQKIGMGMVGQLEAPLTPEDFLAFVHQKMLTGPLRHSRLPKKNIKKVAVLGGSGSFAIAQAKAQGADAYVTADLKYHDFFQGDTTFLLVDIGHYESEQFTKNLILDFLNKKIPNFAFALAQSTNPVNYF
jgi:dinuclear metal center YbgI/SA1388 family protein